VRAEEGALVISSIDGDYLRTPLTKVGWGLANFSVIVGDTEAPLGGSNNEWQLVEGSSVTGAAAASPSLFCYLLLEEQPSGKQKEPTCSCLRSLDLIGNLAYENMRLNKSWVLLWYQLADAPSSSVTPCIAMSVARKFFFAPMHMKLCALALCYWPQLPVD
jgi:hypothetical protein